MDISSTINILLWIGALSGILLMLLMLASIVFGIDSDLDIDADGPDSVDSTGSFGLLKSGLTFLSIASFTIRAVMINSSWSWAAAIASGLVSGIIAVLIVGLVFRLLLKNQEIGNWSLHDAVAQVGSVYIPIPENGVGKIIVPINGINREVEAKTNDGKSLPTDAHVLVLESTEKLLIVAEYNK